MHVLFKLIFVKFSSFIFATFGESFHACTFSTDFRLTQQATLCYSHLLRVLCMYFSYRFPYNSASHLLSLPPPKSLYHACTFHTDFRITQQATLCHRQLLLRFSSFTIFLSKDSFAPVQSVGNNQSRD